MTFSNTSPGHSPTSIVGIPETLGLSDRRERERVEGKSWTCNTTEILLSISQRKETSFLPKPHWTLIGRLWSSKRRHWFVSGAIQWGCIDSHAYG